MKNGISKVGNRQIEIQLNRSAPMQDIILYLNTPVYCNDSAEGDYLPYKLI